MKIVAHTLEKLLKRMKDSQELELLWWGTCAEIFLLQFSEGKREKDEIVVEVRIYFAE